MRENESFNSSKSDTDDDTNIQGAPADVSGSTTDTDGYQTAGSTSYQQGGTYTSTEDDGLTTTDEDIDTSQSGSFTTATSGGESGLEHQSRENGLVEPSEYADQWASQQGNSYNAANEQTDAGNTGSFLSGNYSVTTGSDSGRVVTTGDSRDTGDSSDSDDWGSSGRNLAAFYTPAGGEETSQAETGAGGKHGSTYSWSVAGPPQSTPTSTTTPPTFTDTSVSYMGGGGQLDFVQPYDLTSVHPLLGQSDLLPVTPGQFLGPSEIQAIATAPTPGTTSPPPVNFQTLESRGQLPNDALETGIGRMSADAGPAVEQAAEKSGGAGAAVVGAGAALLEAGRETLPLVPEAVAIAAAAAAGAGLYYGVDAIVGYFLDPPPVQLGDGLPAPESAPSWPQVPQLPPGAHVTPREDLPPAVQQSLDADDVRLGFQGQTMGLGAGPEQAAKASAAQISSASEAQNAHKYAGKTVEEILKGKKGSIKQAELPPGSPSWNDILKLTWEEIEKRAKQGLPGYKTIKKLLTDSEYDK